MTTRHSPSSRLNRLKESQIREMTRLAIECGAINLSQGFPDFAPPLEIREAAARAVMEGTNQYTITWGLPSLRQKIAASYRDRYSPHFDWVDPDQHVTVCCGVTEGITASLMATIERGDEVIIIEPAHENYAPAVRFAGGTPVFVPLLPPDYSLDSDRIGAAVTRATKAIVCNTPHNPSGRVFTHQELSDLARLCKEKDLLVVTDEIYDRILYDGRSHVPLATLPEMAERTITVGGLGKTFAVTGWRLGQVVAPEPWSTAVRKVHDFSTICAPTPLQEAAATALDLPESFYEKQTAEYHQRRDLLMRSLADSGFRATPPEGAYYVLADYEGWNDPRDGSEFAYWLTREVGVAVVNGASFYETPGHGDRLVRFAFAKKLETLAAVRGRLVKAFERRRRG